MAAGTPSMELPEGLRAVIWDIDGTLVESSRLSHDATNVVLAKGGYAEISMEDYKFGTRYPTAKRMAFHSTGDTSAPVGVDLARQFDDLYVGLVTPSTVPEHEGVREILAEFRAAGCQLGALSNACTAYVRAVLSTHGWTDDFEVQFGTDDVPAAKPSPEGLLKICGLMGVAPKECVYIGDAPTDGQAASSAGMRSVGVDWGASSYEQLVEHFDEVVSSSGALRSALLRERKGAVAAQVR